MMWQNKWAKIGLIGLLLFMTTFTTLASSIDEAKDQKDDLENKIEETKELIEDLETTKVGTQQYIQQLDDEINTLDEQIVTIEQQLVDKQATINRVKSELKEAKETQERQYELTKERIRFMYEYGDTAYINALLESNSLTDLFSKMEYVEEIVEYDKNILTQLVAVKEEIEAYEAQLEKEELELEHLTAELGLQKEKVEQVRTMKANELEVVSNDIEESKKALSEYEESLKETEALIEKLEFESQLKYAGGLMEWPVPGSSYISSYFGTRIHPIFKTQSFHTGIDIPATTGTETVAVAAGKVVDAGWSNAYGNYIIIDHGSGYMSFYGHNSKLLVEIGDTVSKWQPVTQVGSTGYSTGPHLHFGIRLSGEWIDPLTVLKH